MGTESQGRRSSLHRPQILVQPGQRLFDELVLGGVGKGRSAEARGYKNARSKALFHRRYDRSEHTSPAHAVKGELPAVDVRARLQVVDASLEILDQLDQVFDIRMRSNRVTKICQSRIATLKCPLVDRVEDGPAVLDQERKKHREFVVAFDVPARALSF